MYMLTLAFCKFLYYLKININSTLDQYKVFRTNTKCLDGEFIHHRIRTVLVSALVLGVEVVQVC